MNQIISQHGWAFDSNVWTPVRKEAQLKGWLFQDNERGYYSEKKNLTNWEKDNDCRSIRLILCHSLGINLINKNIIRQATHFVFINSFYNFIPKNNEEKLIIRALNRMKKKINNEEITLMLKDFLKNVFMPNTIDLELGLIFEQNLKNINRSNLLDDFEKLYSKNNVNDILSKNSEVLIIKSKNDCILNNYSCDEFINSLNRSQTKKPQVLELEHQGHLTRDINIFKIVEDWLKNKYES